uniref:Protein amnionless n=1 Tax=Anas platyrhynchos TaxID=8839 RepID=A0A8B9SLB3_ANAPL
MPSEGLALAGTSPQQSRVTFASLLLPAAARAAYKQWIPNTNFETASNWDKERVPCASDVIHFEKNKVPVMSLFFLFMCLFFLPLNGELLLAPGAGFAAFDGSWDVGCGSGTSCRAGRPSNDVSPVGGREPAGRIFSVDEERVPCQYDDVIFQPETSFRVNLDSSQPVIRLRSISLMGQVTRSWGERPQHLLTASPGRCKHQFHGNGTLQVTGARCPHSSGCACGNTQVSLPGEIWECALEEWGDSSPGEGPGGRGTDAALLSSRTDTASAPPCSGQRGARRCPARAPCGPSGTAAGSAVSGGPERPGGGHSAAVTPCAVHNRQRKRALFAPFQQQVCFASFKIKMCRVRAFPRLRARIC